jgi:hypothetical protein
MLAAATVTQPSSNVRRLPLENLASAARNGTPRVVTAQANVERLKAAYEQEVKVAETYLATMKSEFEAKITEAEIELDQAVTERRRAQHAFLRDLIDNDVFVDVKDLNELARSKEFESK